MFCLRFPRCCRLNAPVPGRASCRAPVRGCALLTVLRAEVVLLERAWVAASVSTLVVPGTRSGRSLPEGVLYLLPGLAQAAAGLVAAAPGLHRPVAGQAPEGLLDPAAGLGIPGGRLALGPLAVSRGGLSHIRHRITLPGNGFASRFPRQGSLNATVPGR